MNRIAISMALAGVLAMSAAAARGDEFADLAKRHPAAVEVEHLFGDAPAGFKATGLTRKDYLPLIAGVVDYWKHFQNVEGAIIDPYEKKERQYSTPAFALASAILVEEAGRKDLLDASTRAMTFALDALANKTTADQHADFYIPMLMHARRILGKQGVARETVDDWDNKLRSIVPEKNYRDTTGGGNWNLVNVSGELLRRKDGLVAQEQLEPQMAYLERCLSKQEASFTKFGMYHDANSPLAYDAFPRLWLEDAYADGDLEGDRAAKSNHVLRLGGISSLLLLSPSGEWATGGRSAQHQWNEAENAVIAECNAAYWHKHGNDAVAGSFKRAAHLCITSMRRWVRPSGEFWIVKNFADPASRFGYEGYSFSSQYNLLPAAMLAIAYERADESVAERPKPGETNSYVFDCRDTFHKVVACVQGDYAEIDVSADPHYNATGLLRVHKSGVPLSPLTDAAPAHRGYEAAGDKTSEPGLTPGIQWNVDGRWTSLASFASERDGADPKNPPKDVVRVAALEVKPPAPGRREFTIRYQLGGAGARDVEESYVLNAQAIEVTSRVGGDVSATRVALPVLVSDGVRANDLTLAGNKLRVERTGGVLTYEVIKPADVKLAMSEPRLPTRNGYVQAAVAELPAGSREVTYRITLEPPAAKRP